MEAEISWTETYVRTYRRDVRFTDEEIQAAAGQGFDITRRWQLENYLGSHPEAWAEKLLPPRKDDLIGFLRGDAVAFGGAVITEGGLNTPEEGTP